MSAKSQFSNSNTVFKSVRPYLIYLVISLILPIVISIANHGISDGMNNLLNFVGEKRIASKFFAPMAMIAFSWGKNLLVLYYFLTNWNCSILARDALYLRWRIDSTEFIRTRMTGYPIWDIFYFCSIKKQFLMSWCLYNCMDVPLILLFIDHGILTIL